MSIEESFSYLGIEYSIGANVVIISIIDKSYDHSILIQEDITKFAVDYSYNDETYTSEVEVVPHVNSVLVFLTNLPAETDIVFTPKVYYNKNGKEEFGKLTNEIEIRTLPYGNITYDLLLSGDIKTDNDINVENKIIEVLGYINSMGAYVVDGYDSYTTYAKTIPIKYNYSNKIVL